MRCRLLQGIKYRTYSTAIRSPDREVNSSNEVTGNQAADSGIRLKGFLRTSNYQKKHNGSEGVSISCIKTCVCPLTCTAPCLEIDSIIHVLSSLLEPDHLLENWEI